MTKSSMVARLLLAMLLASPAAAQPGSPFGPPIDPQQVFRSQPQPAPPPPPPSYISPPTGAGALVKPLPPPPPGGDRVARCHHMAGVERVPQSQRGAYINQCMQAD